MLQTRRLKASDPEQVEEAARLLRAGGLVAFATETVYGLGANALSAEAVERIFQAKQRPAWDPLIVHVGRVDDVGRVAIVPEEQRERLEGLMRAFWPGPLTLLLPRRAGEVPDAVTAGRALVGVRVPGHPAALALLRAAGVPVAAPSANLFGHVSPTTAAHVLADLDGRIDAVLDAGPCGVGVESTVLDPLQTPMLIYRQGAVSAETLRAVSGVEVEVYRPAVVEPEERRASLPSPGVGLRHYAPRAELVLVEGEAAEVWRRAMQESAGRSTGVLWPGDWERPAGGPVTVEPWGVWTDAASRAATLFSGLRALDAKGVAAIVCPQPPAGDGLEDALRDRLEKGARRR